MKLHLSSSQNPKTKHNEKNYSINGDQWFDESLAKFSLVANF
jgi:hypothetical protein